MSSLPSFLSPSLLLPRPVSNPPIPFLHSSPPQACTPNPQPNPSSSQPPLSPVHSPLLSAILIESERIQANFFTPGHKRGLNTHPAFHAALGPPAFSLDLPELPALDNLFSPEGVLEESQKLAADTFTPQGSDQWRTYFLVNGTTCGVEAALLATVTPGRKVILPRNAHQCAVHALVLGGGVPVWLDPIYDQELDLLHGVSVHSVRKALQENQGEVDAVLLVSPTYHGVCSNMEGITAVSREYGVSLIVDEAHGSHFSFHHLLPQSACESGADIVIQSTHKTLGALTQAAMMHVKIGAVEIERIDAAVRMVQSSSPSYLLLASLEAATVVMEEQGDDLMSGAIDLARNCAVRIASLDGFRVLGVEGCGMGEGVKWGLDATRVTVLLPKGVNGYELDTHLIDQFGVYCELPSFRHATFVITAGNTRSEVDRLVTSLALFEATTVGARMNGLGTEQESEEGEDEWIGIPRYARTFGEASGVSPRQAFFATAESVDTDEAIDRICVETLCPYPPGIPVLVPGERITRECIDVLRAVLDAGGSVSGASDESLSTIRVIVDETQVGVNMR